MLKGVYTALITPYKENKKINYEKFIELIEEQISKGVDGLVILGTTGEASSLSEKEQIKIIKLGIKVVKKRVKLIIGCRNKTKYCKNNEINLLIDDTLKNCIDAEKNEISTIWFINNKNNKKRLKQPCNISCATSWIDIYNKIKEIRSIRPEISITTDVLVGFPGETESMFQRTIQTRHGWHLLPL